jgi:glycogen operon protein
MLCAGDEMGRTQNGNNNAYCQDNELSWIDWELDDERRELLEFTSFLIHLRREHPVFHRRRFFQGRRIRGADVEDLTWFEPSGHEMTDEAWDTDFARALTVRLGGESIDETDENGERVVDDTFLLLINGSHESVSFTLPPARPAARWDRVLDTGEPDGRRTLVPRGDRYRLRARWAALFKARSAG